MANFYSDKLSNIQKLQDNARQRLIALNCISSNNDLFNEADDLEDDYQAQKNSSRKNRVNVLEFESGRNFMSGKTITEMSTIGSGNKDKDE